MRLLAAIFALALLTGTASAELKGQYIEARTCDIWTGPCFANAETNLTGKHAVLGWKVETGSFAGVQLDGLGVVAVVAASDTLGLPQTGKAKAVLIVDQRANDEQKAALIQLAKQQGGDLTQHVVKVSSDKFEFNVCPCDENGCATLKAGAAKIETRCLNGKHDKICGNESAYYPPLVQGVTVTPAMAVEHSYQGDQAGAKWSDGGRRGAYLGTFSIR